MPYLTWAQRPGDLPWAWPPTKSNAASSRRFPTPSSKSATSPGDGDHYAATVTSEAFRGKTRVQQHQMVNAAFGTDMGTVLHSLALQTKAPD